MFTEAAVIALSGSVARALCSRYVGGEADDVASPVIDLIGRWTNDALTKRKVARTFEQIGDEVVNSLLPLFPETPGPDFATEAVAFAVAGTVERALSQTLIAQADLDPHAVASALLETPAPETVGFNAAEEALYRRALSETARVATEAAHVVPGFDRAVTERQLARSSELLHLVSQALRDLSQLRSRVQAIAPDANGERVRYEVDYRNALRQSLDKVELFGVSGVRDDSKEQPLSIAYVSLDADLGDGGETLSGADLVSRTADGTGRLLIRGAAGSGKTTLFRWIALCAARVDPEVSGLSEGLPHPVAHSAPPFSPSPVAGGLARAIHGASSASKSALARLLALPPISMVEGKNPASEGPSWATRVPFFLRLRDCTDGRLPKPEDFPDFAAREIGSPPTRWVESVLRDGRGLVLLDGVDEVPGSDRRALRRAVSRIVQTYPDNLFLVSTRPEAVGEEWLSGDGFGEARVNPLTPSGRTELVRSWHRAVAAQLPDPTPLDISELLDTGERLVAQLAESPRIARLATNPLLCAMVCALHRERHEHLPKSARDLCNAACEMLLHRRELESGVDTQRFSVDYSALNYEQKRAVIQRVAHYMVRNEDSAIDRTRALHEVTESLRTFPSVGSPDPNAVLNGLLERSGVLREDKPGSVEFVHNTLKEYLAAERFVYDHDVGVLAKRFNDPTLEPVLLFACADRDQVFATDLLRAVLDGATDADRHERQVFAVRARAVALHLDPDLAGEIDRFQRDLFPPRSMAEAEALAEIGEPVVPYLRYRSSHRSRAAAACIRALGIIGTEAAVESIRGYLVNTTRAVRTELLRALDPLEVPWFRDRFLQIDPQFHSAVERREYYAARRRAQDLTLIDAAALAVAEHIDLSSTSVRDLTPLSAARSLNILIASNTDVASLDPLRTLKTLEVVDISYVQDIDLEPLGSLPNLYALNAEGSLADLSPLWNPGRFEALNMLVAVGSSIPIQEGSPPPLIQTAITARSRLEWESLGQLPELQTLRAVSSFVRDGDLESFAAFGALSLTDLTITDSEVEPDALVFDHSGLTHLGLEGLMYTDDLSLGHLPELRTLNLQFTGVEDIRAVANLRKLEAIDLRACPVSDYGPLVGLPDLKEVGVGIYHQQFLERFADLDLDGVLVLGPRRSPEYRTLASALGMLGLASNKDYSGFGTVTKLPAGRDPFAELGWYVSPRWGIWSFRDPF